MYGFAMMCAFWITEALPPPVTSLLPMILFPLMGVLSSDEVAYNYMNDTNMMLLGSVVIAIAIENSGLHIRIALYVIKLIGCSVKKLHLGLCFVTVIIAMWITNTAATALMIPIVEGTLQALKREGLIKMWKDAKPGKVVAEEDLKPTNITQCYYISIAYCSLMGGTATIIGSASHLAFKGVYETRFPKSPGVEFAPWMMLNLPIMIISNILIIMWLQVLYLGLWRPDSKAAQELLINKEAVESTEQVIHVKIKELGPLKFSEICVGFCFVLSIFLWFFRQPGFMDGWPIYISDVKCGDAVVAIFILMIFFLLPLEPSFIYFCSKDESKRPTTNSEGILSWKIISKKMNWGMIFLLGGGFAMADAARASGMTKLIAEFIRTLIHPNKLVTLFVVCLTASVLTQFLSSNVACVTILTSIVLDLSVASRIHPLYLGLANALACCYSVFLPVSTPPNVLVAGPSRMRAKEMMVSGSGTYVVCLICLLLIYPLYAPLVWDFSTFPTWAEEVNEEVNEKDEFSQLETSLTFNRTGIL